MLFTLVACGSQDATLGEAQTQQTPYIEPNLLSVDSETVSVIVTAGDSQNPYEN
jgi:hypothetical protein